MNTLDSNAQASFRKRHRLGLVVGKFSPLHLGHEHVIRTAQACCDQVLVLGYSQPAFAGCDRLARQGWIDQRCPGLINIQLDDAEVARRCMALGLPFQPMPENLAPDAVQQAYLAWLLQGPVGLRPDAMVGSETYLEPCAHLLSQRLGHEVSPICVDLHRQVHPISATRIRSDVHAHAHWLGPQVQQSFVRHIVILGGESSGKTTLAQALAAQHDTNWVPEYGRERWEQQGGQLTLHDLIDIGRIQLEREQALAQSAKHLLFCDTSPLTTLGYAEWMFQQQPAALIDLAKQPYDLAVLCRLDFEFVQDGTRQGEAFSQRQHDWSVHKLSRCGVPWLEVHGSVQARMAQLCASPAWRALSTLPLMSPQWPAPAPPCPPNSADGN
jgi:HTH-type transcriptional repressor of NAD biosynthesis genes